MQYDNAPAILREYLMYLSVVNGKSQKTIYEYHLDLVNYLKFIKKLKYSLKEDLDEIIITDIDINFIKTITLEDTYEYLYHLKEIKNCQSRTLNRKSCSIRGFFKYLVNKKHYFDKNPVENLESSAIPHTLPKYLSLEECTKLLQNVSGKNSKRDYAALVLFLNCGMRLSELVSINLSDIGGEFITITGKGNKQRSLYLNDACKSAIEDYITNERPFNNLTDDARNALFVSQKGSRMTTRAVQYVVEKRLKEAGLSDKNYSTHKLRHTAATMMHKYGGVDIRVLQDILGHENLGTTQIYTHVDSEQIRSAVDANPVSKIKQLKKESTAD